MDALKTAAMLCCLGPNIGDVEDVDVAADQTWASEDVCVMIDSSSGETNHRRPRHSKIDHHNDLDEDWYPPPKRRRFSESENIRKKPDTISLSEKSNENSTVLSLWWRRLRNPSLVEGSFLSNKTTEKI